MGIIFGGYVLTYAPLSVNFSLSEHSAPYNFRETGRVASLQEGGKLLGSVLDGRRQGREVWFQEVE